MTASFYTAEVCQSQTPVVVQTAENAHHPIPGTINLRIAIWNNPTPFCRV